MTPVTFDDAGVELRRYLLYEAIVEANKAIQKVEYYSSQRLDDKLTRFIKDYEPSVSFSSRGFDFFEKQLKEFLGENI